MVENPATRPSAKQILEILEVNHHFQHQYGNIIKTRVLGVTRSVSAARWEGDGFDFWAIPRHS